LDDYAGLVPLPLKIRELDPEANARKGPRISRAGSKAQAWVIPTNEELMIARHTGLLLGLVEARV
jgi:acetate kinase